jgi:hypothetical protein
MQRSFFFAKGATDFLGVFHLQAGKLLNLEISAALPETQGSQKVTAAIVTIFVRQMELCGARIGPDNGRQCLSWKVTWWAK